MSDLFFYILIISLITSGITGIMIYSEIAKPWRDGWNWMCEKLHATLLQQLTYCTLCLGFWVSIVLQYFLTSIYVLEPVFVVSFASAFICWTLNAITQYFLWLGAKEKIFLEDYLASKERKNSE